MAPTVGLGHHVLFGAGGETAMHPGVVAVVLLATALILALPRKYVICSLLPISVLLPLGQEVMVGPLHFQAFRILFLFAWIRLLWQRYNTEGVACRIRLNQADRAIIWYAVSSLVCFTLLWRQSGAFKGQLGEAYNVLGVYFVCRFFIRDWADVQRALKTLVVVAVIIAACMLNEQVTGRNILAILGGVPESAQMRQGYLRSQGPFRVYLTAGAFGATLLPVFLSLWHKGGARVMASIGMIAALIITITSRTSTAVSAVLAGVIGVAFWPLRDRMRLVRRGLVCVLMGLHVVMKAPVWALIARIDIVGGSTGWHRYKIIDNFVRHFWDWCLLGSRNYWSWDGGDDMWDLANQYIAIGESSGLLPLLCFLAAIVYCFKRLGIARKAAGRDHRRAWFLWLFGVALFSNLIAFFGISYFDQSRIYWYVLLAMVVAVSGARAGRAAIEPSRLAPTESEPPVLAAQ